jgi:hypothetical protein
VQASVDHELVDQHLLLPLHAVAQQSHQVRGRNAAQHGHVGNEVLLTHRCAVPEARDGNRRVRVLMALEEEGLQGG